MAIPTRRLPHLPKLVEDYFYDFGKVEGFFNGDFRDAAAFDRQAERVLARRIPRDELAVVLAEQNRSYGCGPGTLARIDSLAREEACAVVTGQQVGLFSGPLYTIYKALTAIKLAESLNRRGPGRFVPVFWLASDDHDSAEIDHIVLLDKDNALQEIRCPMPAGQSKVPASKIVLTEDISDCLRRLSDSTLDSEFKAGVISGLAEDYRPGRTWAEAFARWLTRMFASRGLILIDAADPRLKKLGGPVFYREIAGESAATPPALAASRKLREAGYGEQIQLHEWILNIFYAERERRAVQWTGTVYEVKDSRETYSKADFLALAEEKPLLFSPNVLLRPIYQDALLPTVAYIGGPGEIAYFAQMKGVYEKFGLPMPVIYPRKGLTIVEKKVARILEKFDLDIPEFWGSTESLLRSAAESQIPESLGRALGLASSHVERDFEPLVREISAFEPTLKESAHLAQGKMIQQLKFLEKKILQAAKTRNDIAVQQLRKAGDHLYPGGHLQERVFNIVPYLLKYGPGFLDQLDQAIGIDETDHQVLTME